jgi:hypothetical protein
MLTKNRLATAVAIGLGASVGVISSANAASVFFPTISVGPSVTTLITTMNYTTENYNNAGQKPDPEDQNKQQYLHYRLYFKSGLNADDRSASCGEINKLLPTSEFDIQTIDLGGKFGATTLGVLFEDPTEDGESYNNRWAQAGRSYALASTLTQPVRGYLIVDNRDDPDDDDADPITGEAFIFDFGSGASWGYQAYTNDSNSEPDDAEPPSDYDEFNYYNETEAGSASPSTVTFMPPAEVTTAFFVTPLGNTSMEGDYMGMTPGNKNAYEATIGLRTGFGGGYAFYDRDENPSSGTVDVSVVCTGRVDFTELLSDGLAEDAKNGGYAQVYNHRTGAPGDVKFDPELGETNRGEAVIAKLEYNRGGLLNGEAVIGIFNNGFLLRPKQVANAPDPQPAGYLDN